MTVFVFNINAQYKYSARSMFYGGGIIPHSKNLESMEKNGVFGGEIAFEWTANGEEQWQQFWRFPNIGAGLGFINLGNNKLLGNAIYAYPYVLIPVSQTNYFNLNIKLGAGLSYVTKTWKDGDTFHGVDAATANSAFSFPINFYLNGSANFELFLNNQFSLTLDAGYAHISNGSFKNPNFGVNIIYGQLGLKYSFVESNARLVYNPAYELPFDFEGKFIISGFSRQINYNDNKNFFVGSIHGGLTFPLTNRYALGGGFDAFYDGAYTNRPTEENPGFDKYKIAENKFSNKIRVGISLNNELIMGRTTGLIDFGIYLYDPIKNAYKTSVAKRGIFYKYDPSKEDGWNYIRLGIRYRFFDNLVVQAAIKLHLQTAEMFELGIGYMLPFYKPKYASLNNSLKSYRLYHYDQKEAAAFPSPWVN